MPVISLRHVSKRFTLQQDRARSFQELFLNALHRRRRSASDEYWALRDVSFDVQPGEAVGIVGPNGTGKSTCLKLVARIIEPTSGDIAVRGRVSALLELGTGFHPELSGRENIYLYGSLLGLRRREMAARFDSIVAFAELERFVDIPVKFYSSGMYVRLAFATAINVDAEVLLVDEVLAVGDQRFQARCLERIHELKQRGVTILFVSHSLDAVRSLCERAIWLDEGEVREDGVTDSVVASYLQRVYEQGEEDDLVLRRRSAEEAEAARRASGAEGAGLDDGASAKGQGRAAPAADGDVMNGYARRWGTGEAEITDVTLLDASGQERLLLTVGEPATIVVRYRTAEPIARPMFGLAIHRSDGLHVTGPNSVFSGYDIPAVEGEGEVRYCIPALPLLPGIYYLSASICDHSGNHAYDFHSLMYRFRVQPGRIDERYGAIHIPAQWEHVAAQPAPQPEEQRA